MDKKSDKVDCHGNDNATMIQLEIEIPGSKVGAIIGKGGATIKYLQEKSGARLFLINQNRVKYNQQENSQLRIRGHEKQVNEAKKLVHDLLNIGKTEMMLTGRPNEIKTLEFKALGRESFIGKKYDDALFFYTKAIEACPKDPIYGLAKLYRTRASVYEIQGKFNKVIEDCNKVIELIPKCVDTYLRRSRAFEQRNELQKALDDANYASKYGSLSGRIIAARVQKKLENEKNKIEGRKDKRESDDDHYFFPNSQRNIMKLQIQRKMCSFIIGRCGDVITEIKKNTGANCEFDGSVIDHDQDQVGILISGSVKQMENAKQMIKAIIDHHLTENSLANDFKLNLN